MNPIKRTCLVVMGMALVLSTTAQAGELIYKPLNPSFGGDPFVGSYLLGKAQAQDTNKDSSASRSTPTSATERLLQSLESRLISQLIADVSSGDVSEGSFDSDEFGVVVSDNGGQLVGGLFNP